MSRPGRTFFGAGFGQEPVRVLHRFGELPELRRAGAPLLPAPARLGGARADRRPRGLARRRDGVAPRVDRGARPGADRGDRPRPRRGARDGPRARGAAPRGFPASEARARDRGVGPRAPLRARLPPRAGPPGRALGRPGLRARLLVPRPPSRAPRRAEPAGRPPRARGRHGRGGDQPERPALPHLGRHRLPLRPRRRRRAPLPADGAARRREPHHELRLRLQRAAAPAARQGRAPLRALPPRRAGRGEAGAASGEPGSGPPRAGAAPVRPDPPLPPRARPALDLLPQRLLPLGGAPRERAPPDRGGARAPRPLRGDRRLAEAPPRQPLRAARRAAALEPRGASRAHGLRRPSGPGAQVPPAPPLALARLRAGRTQAPRRRSTPRAMPAR